ncbi:MAG: MarR family winged helix-turn-helix transcriptional regulator [Psychrobium sp.]
MSSFPSKLVTDTWIAFFSAHSDIFEFAQQALKKQGCPPLSWYDTLWELDKVGEKGLRPYELETLVLFHAQYSVSRLLTRMEKDGYIKKVRCAEDGRGFRVVITDSGREIRSQMWLTYSQVINNALGNKLSDDECEQLKSLLYKLKN